MRKVIDVNIASDGLIVIFDDNTICYYEAETLYRQKDDLTSQTFLDHDPFSSPAEKQLVESGAGNGFERVIGDNVLCISSQVSVGRQP